MSKTRGEFLKHLPAAQMLSLQIQLGIPDDDDEDEDEDEERERRVSCSHYVTTVRQEEERRPQKVMIT